jgi:predicted transcriptional regulator of viral defense system
MKQSKAIEILRKLDKKGKYVFTKKELHRLFFQDSHKTCTESINRLVRSNILNRACRGIYVNPHATSSDSYTIEHIAKALRKGEYNYVSLESILSEYGIISQIPIDRLTIMTTGRKGIYKTTFGTIEYTHTKRPLDNIINGIKQIENRPLRIASKSIAWRDLKRVGRNINMVNAGELNDSSK